MKSFLNTGRFVFFFTLIKSSFDPLKYFSSVSTDMQEIPFFSYCLANSIKLILLLTISPAEGLDLFSSPIIEIF